MLNTLIAETVQSSINIVTSQITRILPSPSFVAEGSRIFDAALPVLAQYQPIGTALSYGTTAWCLYEKGLHFYSFEPSTPQQCLKELLKGVKTVAHCANIFFQSPTGHFIYSVLDLIEKFKELSYEPSLKKGLLVISRALYFYLFVKGNSPQIHVVALLVQAASNFLQMTLHAQAMHQSGEGLSHEKNLACLSETVLGIIHLCQASHCISQIRTEKSFEHPLKDLAKKVDAKRVILTDVHGKEHEFGSHFHGYGKGLVKGMNICFIRTVLPDGTPGIELSFKLNHVHRERLEKTLEKFSKLSTEERQEVLKALDIQASDFKVETSALFTHGVPLKKKEREELSEKDWLKSLGIEAENLQSLTPQQVIDFKKAVGFISDDEIEEPFSLDDEQSQDKDSDAEAFDFKIATSALVLKDGHKITLEGLGTLMIGRLDEYYEKDRLFVQVREGQDIDTFIKVLSPIGLCDALQPSSPEDLLRMKVGLLFRAFFPRDAFTLERSERFFDSSLDRLKCEIITQKPEMERIFQEHLPRMEPREILPGYFRYAIPGFGQNIGVRALTHSLLEHTQLNEEQLDSLATIFKIGLISHEWQRKYENVDSADDVVYTQAVVEENIKYSHPLREFSAYSNSPIRLFLSSRILETPTFQYLNGDDLTGFRNIDEYPQRPSIPELTQTMQAHLSSPSPDFAETDFHEILVKDRIPPEAITGMYIKKPKHKELVVSHFRKTGIIKTDSEGKETINGIPLDEFIHTGSKVLTEAMIRRASI